MADELLFAEASIRAKFGLTEQEWLSIMRGDRIVKCIVYTNDHDGKEP